ncbi:MAG TPA: hypothetical protein VGH74_00465 [Planctomycetaceae bacterium]
MHQIKFSAVVILAAILGSAAVGSRAADEKNAADELEGWSSDFSTEKDALTSRGKNPYFILEPGYQLILEGGKERLVISVLNETKIVDGVETRIVEERETKNDKLIEVSRNFFAISKRTNNVYYFGEEVDDYKDGKIVGHPGAWRSGEKGAQFGLMMPGLPLLKARFYNEVAPKTAMDRAEIVGVSVNFKTPAGEFKNCLKIEETTPLEPGNKEHKHYAPGIGLVQDGSLKLVKYGTGVAAADNAPAVAASAKKKAEDEEGEEEEEEINFADAPAAVQKALQREAGGAKIDKVDKMTKEGRTVYEADAKIDGKNYEIVVTAEGLLLSKKLDEDEEEDDK